MSPNDEMTTGPIAGSESLVRWQIGRCRARQEMTRIPVMTTLSLSEIKARLSEIVDEVERHHERVVLTRNGTPAAVILSPEDLEALEDTLDLLSDPDALAEIRAARREVDAGKAVTADELRAKYLTK
jgi:prevent-host-death family protein